jgi:hypothetical protein
MSVAEKVKWFLQLPTREFDPPAWIAEDLVAEYYKVANKPQDKEGLKGLLLACGQRKRFPRPAKQGARGVSLLDPNPLTDSSAARSVDDFLAWSDASSPNLRLFLLHFCRMELFLTIRWLKTKHGNVVPRNDLFNAICSAVGTYQGAKMFQHLCPDPTSNDAVSLETIAAFYYDYEEMLFREGSAMTATLDLEAEMHRAVEEGAADQLEAVLSNPQLDANSLSESGQSALHAACLNYDNEDVLDVLIASKNVNLSLANEEGQTALHLALAEQQYEVAARLIAGGSDLDAQDNEGMTALMLAVDGGVESIVGTLIRQGVKLDLKNKEGQTAEDLAKEEGDPDILRKFETQKN